MGIQLGRWIIFVIGSTFLAACEGGLSGLDTGGSGSLVERRQVGDFSIEFADTGRALFVAKGNEVVLRPAPGFCIAPESVDVGPASGFAMIGDCPAEASGASTIDLPRAIPAILTVSIAEEPMFGSGGPRGEALSDLERFLATPEGLATVGRSGAADAVRIIETRPIGDALYVHVEDRDVSALPMFGARFWRAFVELNGRMVLVSLSGFSDGPLEAEEMLAHLAAQVGVLRTANGSAVPEAERRLAAGAEVGAGTTLAVAEPAAPEDASLAESTARVDGRIPVVVAEVGPGAGGRSELDEGTAALAGDRSAALVPVASVLPPPRGGDDAPADPAATASPEAPLVAPMAPRRPR